MATLEEIVIQLTAESSQLRTQLQSATKVTEDSAKKMEAAISKFSDNSNKSLGFFQTAMATMAGFLGGQLITKGIGLATDAFKGMVGVIGDGIEAAAASDAQFLRLANSLAINGNFSEEAANGLREYANELEETTGVSDEAILSNLAYLESLTRLDAEGLKVAQTGALDLSAALGKDLETTTQAVAKAIEGNGTALKRLGVNFDESKDKAQNFKNVQEALSRFSGIAAANTGSYSGAIKLLGTAFENITKSIGSVFTRNKVVITIIQELAKSIFDLSKSAEKNGDALRIGLAKSLLAIAEAGAITLEIFDKLLRAFAISIEVAKLYQNVNLLRDGFKGLAAAFQGKDIAAALGPVGDSINKIKTDLNDKGIFGQFADKLDEIKNKGFKAFGGISDVVGDSTKKLNDNAKAIEIVSEATKLQEAARTAFVDGLLKESAAIDENSKFRNQVLDLSYADNLTSVQDYNAAKLQLLEEQQAVEQQILEESRLLNNAEDENYLAAKRVLDQKQMVERVKLLQDQKKLEEDAQKQKLAAFSGFFGNLAALSQSSNKDLAAIGKAAALTQATIDGYVAVQGAYKSGSVIGGPALGAAFAAAAGIATAANLAKIAGVGLQSGIDSVPGIGNQDNFPAVLAPGERVVPSKTNEDLTKFLQEQGASSKKIEFTLNLTIAPGTGISRTQAADLVEGINDYIAAGGLPILGST
jgi:hypothetical protein